MGYIKIMGPDGRVFYAEGTGPSDKGFTKSENPNTEKEELEPRIEHPMSELTDSQELKELADKKDMDLMLTFKGEPITVLIDKLCELLGQTFPAIPLTKRIEAELLIRTYIRAKLTDETLNISDKDFETYYRIINKGE